ncbi:auxin-responsive protein IAA32-like [Bidens hawaiensis]|uniref:auxin-responsive protein IAA32-like n=1 Tax=Bidens hawaiensis TaxID=980011 RepID=UPI00404A78EB
MGCYGMFIGPPVEEISFPPFLKPSQWSSWMLFCVGPTTRTCLVSDDYQDLVEWNQLHPYQSPDMGDNVVDERNMFQRTKQQSYFVKVNMDGVLIGRKLCVLDHSSYLSLATQLENMFGKQSSCSLRLSESGSEYSLWYKDRDEQWRIAGDVPWKEFVDSVTRMRIMFKDDTLFRPINTSV